MNDLVYLSATEAIQLFVSKALSPVELMTAVIEHAEEVEPKINAFSETLFEKALQQAQEAEKVYRNTKAVPRPLEGLPVALKDEHFIKGMLRSGAIVEEVEMTWKTEDIFQAADIHYGALFGSAVYDEIIDQQDMAMPYTLAFAEHTMAIAEKKTVMEGLDIEAEIYAELGLLLDDFDALLCPTNAINGLIAGEDYVDVYPEIKGTKLRNCDEGLMTIPFNIISRCPVLSVPSGFARNGVPTGVQIVGPSYEEEVVFQIGTALENATPWFDDITWRPDYRRIAQPEELITDEYNPILDRSIP